MFAIDGQQKLMVWKKHPREFYFFLKGQKTSGGGGGGKNNRTEIREVVLRDLIGSSRRESESWRVVRDEVSGKGKDRWPRGIKTHLVLASGGRFPRLWSAASVLPQVESFLGCGQRCS